MLKEKYEQKYHVKCFTTFTSYFLANLFESKLDAQNNVIKLEESDFQWLQKEYLKFKVDSKLKHSILSFEKFVAAYLNELFDQIKVREIPTLTNFSSNLDFKNTKKI